MKIRTSLPLIFYSIFVIALFCSYIISPFIGLAAIVAGVFMVLSIYASYSKTIKEENLIINNTRFQNVIMAFSLSSVIIMSVGSTFKVMHWPFAGPILIIVLIANLIPLILSVIDILMNFKTVKTHYGYSYLIILLPVFLFIPFNLGRITQERTSPEMIALKAIDDHTKNYCYSQAKKNRTFIDKFLKDDSLISKINKETERCTHYIRYVKQGLIDYTGGFKDADNIEMYQNARDRSMTHSYLFGISTPAYTIKKELENYVGLLNANIDISSSKIDPIAPAPKDDPTIKNEDLKGKDFAELNFERVTMLQALNKLSQLELEVTMAEQQFLLYYQSTHE
jgi:hypothetical protein